MTGTASVVACPLRPFAGLSFGLGSDAKGFSVTCPDKGSQKRLPSDVPNLIGARMKASRLALCRHIEIGPHCVMAMKAQESSRSRSRRHASMKLWMTNDSLFTRPRAVQRSVLACHALRSSQPPALNDRYGLLRIPLAKVAMTLDRLRRSRLNNGMRSSAASSDL